MQILWGTVWRFLKKLKIDLAYDSAIPLLAIYLEKTIIQKVTCTSEFIAALFAIARTWKQTTCALTDEWIEKLWYVYTMEYYSAIKRDSFDSVLMKWMNLVNQKEKNKYHILTHTYM